MFNLSPLSDGARRGRWLVLALALLATAFGPAAAVAAPGGVKPATGIGHITIYSSPRINFSTRIYTNDGITAGPDGALWFTNPANNTIGRISTTGRVRTYKGSGIANPWAITTGSDGALWFTNWNTPSIGRMSVKGVTTVFAGAISGPNSIAPGRFGALWYTNWADWSIGRVTTKGASISYTAQGLQYPQDIVAGSDGAMWFVNGGHTGGGYAIGRISRRGKVTMYPLSHYAGDIAAGPDGNLWFTYPTTNAIGRITVHGAVTTFTAKSISKPWAIAAGPDGALWFLNTGSNTIGRITAKGHVSSYAGALGLSPGGAGITAGPDGAMWFTNPATNTIGRITTNVTPWIFGKTPASGPPGTEVTIVGRNLAHAIQVAFNGAPAAIVSASAGYVVAIVPPAASSGRITVTTPAGTATVNGWFSVTRPTGHRSVTP